MALRCRGTTFVHDSRITTLTFHVLLGSLLVNELSKHSVFVVYERPATSCTWLNDVLLGRKEALLYLLVFCFLIARLVLVSLSGFVAPVFVKFRIMID